ncbi:MAG TPA: VapE domain-containing protein, partial [Polyangiaceae bacterium]|nr:VapE domain-containing protein [Polyangiaceae bacterium]
DQESIKGFISRRIDHYRPPYGRNTVERPRHAVFIATTNENDYLQDPSGGRRFWPVECTAIDLPALERDIDQLWGEATARYLEKEVWHLSEAQNRRATIEQASRQRLSPVDVTVLEYADTLLGTGVRRIEMRQLLAEVFDLSTKEKPANAGALAQQSARALVREGWKRLKPTGRGRTRTQAYEYVGDLLSSQASQANEEERDSDTVQKPPRSQASQAENGEFGEDIPF